MYRTTLRFCLAPSRDFNEKMRDLLRFCEDALVDDVMFFITPEELCIGHNTIEEAKVWTDTILRAKNILKEKGILISLNPWATFAHYDGGRTLKEGQNFRNMVGDDGTKAELTVCPLDENWRKYYVELLNFYVDTLEPDVLWLEDDFRLTNHEPITYGCFCEEHLKLYNEKLGTNYDLPTLRQAIITDEKVKKAFIEISQFTIEDTMKYIVDHVKKQKTFGLMTSGASGALLEGRKYDYLYPLLAKNGGKPYNRLCLNSYRESGSQEYAWRFNTNSMWNRCLAGDKAYFVSEMENYPHTLYTKSAAFVRYQLLTSAPLCLRGTTLSIFEFNGNGIVNGDKYAKVLKDVKPFLSKIDEIGVAPSNQKGVYVLYNDESAFHVQPTGQGLYSLAPQDSWWFAYLEMLGIACRFGTDVTVKGRIVAASHQVLNNYTDEEIRNLFKYNFVLLNAVSAKTLMDRGLGSLIGATSCTYLKERTGKYTIEELATGETVFGVTKLRATAQFFCGDYLKIEYDNPERIVYTNMLDQYENVVGDGITQSCNALILPFTGNTPDFNYPVALICPLRAYVIKKAIGENPVSQNEICFTYNENVCPYMFEKGGKTYIMLTNFAEDNGDGIRLKLNMEFSRVRLLTPDNPEWKTIGFEYEQGNYRMNNKYIQARSTILLVCDKNTTEE